MTITFDWNAARAKYQAARVEYEAIQRLADAWEAHLPAHLHADKSPRPCDFDNFGAYHAANTAWLNERAAYGGNPYDQDDGPLWDAVDRMNDARGRFVA